MKVQRTLVSLVLVAGCAAAQGVGAATSNFDSGTEGWTVLNGARDLTFVSSGGESGGFVMATDDVYGATLWLWSAPATFLGDQSASFGGTLSYFAKASRVTIGGQSAPDVKIKGNGITLAADAGANPGLNWTPYSLTLAPGAWHLDDLSGALATEADVRSVLSNVSALYIRGDYSPLIRGASSGLDSVNLSPVPEPAVWVLAIAGLAMVGCAVPRRR